MNLNTFRNAHYFQLNKEKIEWEKIVSVAVNQQNIIPVDRCNITMEFYFKDKRRRDPDNYACCAKFILDGLVKSKIMQDDNFAVVESLTVKQGGINKKPYINILLEELN
ncbi:hypothetical protein UFOVP103_34 [uncultured Caudovirales phage]|uniref:Uncharacterized protein n=1 Tax=uncultured Caudovirales phage TaxID=2100421 RepID=A0A6J5L3K3_9CAUD|nr:hypothetical protein UFOVP103_34 [uncultured Caudovirales phage]CAB5216929.1 hypothetical protein UFOVP197_21 [uncultured Caudovirales phage]